MGNLPCHGSQLHNKQALQVDLFSLNHSLTFHFVNSVFRLIIAYLQRLCKRNQKNSLSVDPFDQLKQTGQLLDELSCLFPHSCRTVFLS